jgi:aminopeptidase YwaD
MNQLDVAWVHLKHLCGDIGSRRVGSPGNQQATDYFAEIAAGFHAQVKLQSFACMDWHTQGAELNVDGQAFKVHSSPYSLGCNITALLESAGNLAEVKNLDSPSCVMLLHGELTREQLFPSRFPFYNSPEHKQIYRLLNKKRPVAILTATSRNPELAGGQYPFPMIEDGDFDIPSVFLTAEEGQRLISFVGKTVHLVSRAERIPSHGCNVIACFNPAAQKKIVLTAHIDAKAGSPGALDNGTGVVILMLLAEQLQDFKGHNAIELVAINGEDYYGAPGEVAYLKKNEDLIQNILININFDGVGYKDGGTEFSLYGCTNELASLVKSTLFSTKGLCEGETWPQSDHMVFVQQGIPAVAFTSQQFPYLTSTITHTAQDRVELVDNAKLVQTVSSVHQLLQDLDAYFK